MFEPDQTAREHKVVYIANGSFLKLVSGVLSGLVIAGIVAAVVMYRVQGEIMTKLDGLQNAQNEAFRWRDDRHTSLASNFYRFERSANDKLWELELLVERAWRNQP